MYEKYSLKAHMNILCWCKTCSLLSLYLSPSQSGRGQKRGGIRLACVMCLCSEKFILHKTFIGARMKTSVKHIAPSRSHIRCAHTTHMHTDNNNEIFHVLYIALFDFTFSLSLHTFNART